MEGRIGEGWGRSEKWRRSNSSSGLYPTCSRLSQSRSRESSLVTTGTGAAGWKARERKSTASPPLPSPSSPTLAGERQEAVEVAQGRECLDLVVPCAVRDARPAMGGQRESAGRCCCTVASLQPPPRFPCVRTCACALTSPPLSSSIRTCACPLPSHRPPALVRVRARAAELLLRHLLLRHRLNDIGARDEHVGRVAHLRAWAGRVSDEGGERSTCGPAATPSHHEGEFCDGAPLPPLRTMKTKSVIAGE